MKAVCEKVRSVTKSASEKLTGRKRRAYQAEELPSENTIGNMPNRTGYSMKRVPKAEPVKKSRNRCDIRKYPGSEQIIRCGSGISENFC